MTELKRKEQRLLDYRDQLEQLVEERTSELQQIVEDLKQTQSQLIQSEKMASLGVLTAGVAYEINNPLNFIKGAPMGLTHMFEPFWA